MLHTHRRRTAAIAVLMGLAAIFGASPAQRAGAAPAGKKVLLVDSYHSGYPWSDGLEKGVRDVLGPAGVELEIVRMDTKRKSSESEQKAAAAAALEAMTRFRPDVVIAADDNAQEHLVVPFLKGGEVPVVFCGVNWDASEYGYPAPNVTGMIEVEGVLEMVSLFQRDAKGPRIGYVSGDTDTDRKITREFNKRFFNGSMKVYFVKNFEQFKKTFLKAQNEVDMLFLRNFAGIEGWEPEAARAFLLKNVRVPTGSHLDFMADFVIYTIGKVPEEQGEYAARTALRILEGESPADIPVAVNERVRLVVNLEMAEAAGVVVPLSVLKTATVIGRQR